jgi:hypothetical protein
VAIDSLVAQRLDISAEGPSRPRPGTTGNHTKAAIRHCYNVYAKLLASSRGHVCMFLQAGQGPAGPITCVHLSCPSHTSVHGFSHTSAPSTADSAAEPKPISRPAAPAACRQRATRRDGCCSGWRTARWSPVTCASQRCSPFPHILSPSGLLSLPSPPPSLSVCLSVCLVLVLYVFSLVSVPVASHILFFLSFQVGVSLSYSWNISRSF